MGHDIRRQTERLLDICWAISHIFLQQNLETRPIYSHLSLYRQQCRNWQTSRQLCPTMVGLYLAHSITRTENIHSSSRNMT
jgi:hypothetical protein